MQTAGRDGTNRSEHTDEIRGQGETFRRQEWRRWGRGDEPGVKDQPMTRVVAALFVIATVWKQHRCPPTDEWIQEVVVHMYNEILLSYKKECI